MPSVLEGSVFPIQLKQVSVVRDGQEILAPCDLTIEEGEKIAIIGESGSGKTTLLNLIYGEIKPSHGRIRYHGQELTSDELYQAGAYILQSSHIFDGLSALQSKTPSNQTLSGGEKQRLEIARALYHNRQFILADEVKANLDLKNQEKISQLLFSLPQTLVEVIHHYSEEDLKRYDKVIKLEK